MVRIIPWSLPPVKGGSIGGYTPKVDPEPPTPEPEPPAQYYDFSLADLSTFSVYYPTTTLTVNVEKDLTINSTGGVSFSGIVAEDVLGVASLKALIQVIYDGTDATLSTDDLVVSLDPISFAPTFISGTAAITRKLSTTSSNFYEFTKTKWTDAKVTFYVYNGNGEIIQTDEVVLVGGE